MKKDVLLPIGSIVEVKPEHENTKMFMIIGKRVINPATFNVWDYVSVPLPEVLSRKFRKDMNYEENFFYFNHYEIEKVLHTCHLQELNQNNQGVTE